MAIYEPVRTIEVRDYREFCIHFYQPYDPFYSNSDMEMIEDMLKQFDGFWSVEYIDKGDQSRDFFRVNLHTYHPSPEIHTCTLGIVNWEAEEGAPSQEEIQSLLPTIAKDGWDCIYNILSDGDYWYGDEKWDINFVDSLTSVDDDLENRRFVAYVYRCGLNEKGEPYTDYTYSVAHFDVEFNWAVTEK